MPVLMRSIIDRLDLRLPEQGLDLGELLITRRSENDPEPRCPSKLESKRRNTTSTWYTINPYTQQNNRRRLTYPESEQSGQ